MKKKLNLLTLFIVIGLALAACSSTSTPKGAAMKSANLLKSGKYEALVDDLYVDESVQDEKLKAHKAMLVSLLYEKSDEFFKQKGGIKDIQFISEEIDEYDETTAVVLLNYVYGNGDVEQQRFDMRKDSRGQWKVELKK